MPATGRFALDAEEAGVHPSGDSARSLSPQMWRSAARLDLEAASTACSAAFADPQLNGTGCALCAGVFRNTSAKPGTEVFIVDSSPAAAIALGAHRPSEESTYVLCRAASECNADFAARVLKRARQIRAHQCIESLWYVIGARSFDASSSSRLLEELLPLLERGSRITLATPRSIGGAVFGWVDSLLGKRGDDVNMGVRFYPDISDLRRTTLLNAVENESAQQQCA